MKRYFIAIWLLLNVHIGLLRAQSLKPGFDKQEYLTLLKIKHAFNKLDESSKKSRRNFEKYLGKTLFKQTQKTLPQLKEPAYAETMNYMRAGVSIVLQP